MIRPFREHRLVVPRRSVVSALLLIRERFNESRIRRRSRLRFRAATATGDQLAQPGDQVDPAPQNR